MRSRKPENPKKPIGLKEIAAYLGVSQGTVSMALSPTSETTGVAAKTRERVLRAAKELNYRPNFHARTLSSGRSHTIGIMVPAISEGYYSAIIAGIEAHLMEVNYFFLVTSHRWRENMMNTLPEVMRARGAEGLIVVNTILDHDFGMPMVLIGGSSHLQNTTYVRTDERLGTRLALEHLKSQGHTEIAFFRGEEESTATEERWAGILKAAKKLSIEVAPKRTVQMRLSSVKSTMGNLWVGYNAARELIDRKVPFTALFAYNDSTAIGAMRALQDAGRRVPEDVSVIGYDDIPSAEFERPALTTIRQPLHRIGITAAKSLLDRLENRTAKDEVLIEPELIVRASTSEAPPTHRAFSSAAARSRPTAKPRSRISGTRAARSE